MSVLLTTSSLPTYSVVSPSSYSSFLYTVPLKIGGQIRFGSHAAIINSIPVCPRHLCGVCSLRKTPSMPCSGVPCRAIFVGRHYHVSIATASNNWLFCVQHDPFISRFHIGICHHNRSSGYRIIAAHHTTISVTFHRRH